MRINELSVKNFRNFEAATFKLHPHFTVVIGDNGLGKSSVLHAVKLAVSVFFSGLKPDIKTYTGHPVINFEKDVRYTKSEHKYSEQSNLPCQITVHNWQINGSVLKSYYREIATDTRSNNSSNEALGPMREFGLKMFEASDQPDQNQLMPLFAFFDTGRLHKGGRIRKVEHARTRFLQAYRNWDELNSKVYNYPAWLSGLIHDNKQDQVFLGVFKQAIIDICDDVQEVFINGDQIWLEFASGSSSKQPAKTIRFDYLSDGYKVMIGMVAELVYRAIILNEHLGDQVLKHTPGIVMIDELDMHLHPNWQRQVVHKLMQVFPQIQFVATTHSPFVVHSVAKDQLLNLANEEFTGLVNPVESGLDSVIKYELKVEDAKVSPEFIRARNLMYDYLILLEQSKADNNEQQLNSIMADLTKIEDSIAGDPYSAAIFMFERKKAGL